VETRLLPHFLPNVGVRLSTSGHSITYTGDAGPSDDLVGFAEATSLLLAEATFVERVPDDSVGYLNSAREVGEQARRAAADHLVLTHLQPGTDPDSARDAAGRGFPAQVDVAVCGLVVEVS
jgi:ribonuclease BN (tRNA processing enzyme)